MNHLIHELSLIYSRVLVLSDHSHGLDQFFEEKSFSEHPLLKRRLEKSGPIRQFAKTKIGLRNECTQQVYFLGCEIQGYPISNNLLSLADAIFLYTPVMGKSLEPLLRVKIPYEFRHLPFVWMRTEDQMLKSAKNDLFQEALERWIHKHFLFWKIEEIPTPKMWKSIEWALSF